MADAALDAQYGKKEESKEKPSLSNKFAGTRPNLQSTPAMEEIKEQAETDVEVASQATNQANNKPTQTVA